MLQWLTAGSLTAALPAWARAQAMPGFTGPGANPYWNSIGNLVTYPQKLPLILLTDRPVQLETPRPYFLSPLTPNAAFYVRWHLDGHPQAVDLAAWRLQVEGAVERPRGFGFAELVRQFPEVSVTAVNQCSGNSRSFVTPRVPGSQWGNGAMGCAVYTGARLRDVLRACAPRREAVQVQFVGMEEGRGPPDRGAHRFMKSLDLSNPVLDECVLAYAMNGEALPLLNGFPLRLVVPGYFATYWVKALATIRLLSEPDSNYWMKKAYLLPDTPRGSINVEAAQGDYKKVPIGRMPPRAFIVAPDGSGKVPTDFSIVVQGVALSGHGAITKVEVSCDEGASWQAATLGQDYGRHAFRPWTWRWRTPSTPGPRVLWARARDASGDVQGDAPFWNPNGYGYCRFDRQEIVVARAG